jgi:tRNA(Ile2) C34 agmatinyltransferase TiaS
MAIHSGITEQMKSLLVENNIDVNRTTSCTITHDAGGGITEIAVTLLAKKQERKAITCERCDRPMDSAAEWAAMGTLWRCPECSRVTQ